MLVTGVAKCLRYKNKHFCLIFYKIYAFSENSSGKKHIGNGSFYVDYAIFGIKKPRDKRGANTILLPPN